MHLPSMAQKPEMLQTHRLELATTCDIRRIRFFFELSSKMQRGALLLCCFPPQTLTLVRYVGVCFCLDVLYVCPSNKDWKNANTGVMQKSQEKECAETVFTSGMPSFRDVLRFRYFCRSHVIFVEDSIPDRPL